MPTGAAMSRRRIGLPAKTTTNQSDHLIHQIRQSNQSLVTAVEHLRKSFHAMLVGKLVENADDILSQAETALRQAEDIMGHLPETTKIPDSRQLSQIQLLLFPAV
jgi:hypothetical protein